MNQSLSTIKAIQGLNIQVGSAVTLRHEDIKATVRSVTMSVEGFQYLVTFWHQGMRRQEWVYRDEFTEGWDG